MPPATSQCLSGVYLIRMTFLLIQCSLKGWLQGSPAFLAPHINMVTAVLGLKNYWISGLFVVSHFYSDENGDRSNTLNGYFFSGRTLRNFGPFVSLYSVHGWILQVNILRYTKSNDPIGGNAASGRCTLLDRFTT